MKVFRLRKLVQIGSADSRGPPRRASTAVLFSREAGCLSFDGSVGGGAVFESGTRFTRFTRAFSLFESTASSTSLDSVNNSRTFRATDRTNWRPIGERLISINQNSIAGTRSSFIIAVNSLSRANALKPTLGARRSTRVPFGANLISFHRHVDPASLLPYIRRELRTFYLVALMECALVGFVTFEGCFRIGLIF